MKFTYFRSMGCREATGIEETKNILRLAALSLIFLSPIFAYVTVSFGSGSTLLFDDGLLSFFPFRVFLHNAFVHGFSPQWLPNPAGGISLLAEGQSSICFPGTQIIYRAFTAETGWIIEIILAHLIAFTLCYFFFRHLHVSRLGSLFGACLYAFCPLAFIQSCVPAIMWCYTLLPGIYLSCDRFIERRPYSCVCLSIIFSLVFLTGHPVMIIYIGMTVSAYIIFHIVKMGPPDKTFREIAPRFLVLCSTVIVAILVASPQLLPMLNEFKFSARTAGASVSVETLQNTLHLHPKWGALSLFPTPFFLNEGNTSFSNLVRFPLYALFLGIVGVLFGGRGVHRSYFIALGVFSILMALGPYVGLWQFVHSLPVLQYFRYPFRWLFFVPICISFFSARGLDHILNRPYGFIPLRLAKVLKYTILLAGLTAGAVSAILYFDKLLHHSQKAIEYSPWLTGLLWLCTFGMVVAIFWVYTSRSAKRGVMLGVILAVMTLFTTRSFMIQDPLVIRNLRMIGWEGEHNQTEPQTYRTSSAASPGEVWVTNTLRQQYYSTPNLTILNGTFTTGHYVSFIPYWAANVSAWCQDALNGTHEKQIYLNLSSARWLFIPDGSESGKINLPTTFFKDREAYENLNAMPRATLVYSYRHFSNESDLVAYLESDGFDPRHEMTILRQDAEAWNLQLDEDQRNADDTPPEAKIVMERPDRIEIQLNPPGLKGAFLVLSDTYYPGWRALVDGVETNIRRVNYAFRGIKLPEGAKQVVFFFDPLIPDSALLLPTAILAGSGFLVCLHYCLLIKRKKGDVNKL